MYTIITEPNYVIIWSRVSLGNPACVAWSADTADWVWYLVIYVDPNGKPETIFDTPCSVWGNNSKNDIMPVISCLTFWSLFQVISILFCPKTGLSPSFCLCVSLVRQIGLPIHFISVAHCCPFVLIEDITQMWQDGCHIWNYYNMKCYNVSCLHVMTDIWSF